MGRLAGYGPPPAPSLVRTGHIEFGRIEAIAVTVHLQMEMGVTDHSFARGRRIPGRTSIANKLAAAHSLALVYDDALKVVVHGADSVAMLNSQVDLFGIARDKPNLAVIDGTNRCTPGHVYIQAAVHHACACVQLHESPAQGRRAIKR